MDKLNFESTQLILVNLGLNKYKYLEKLPRKSDNALVNLIFQEDSKNDPRVVAIKYNVLGEKDNHNVLYYSEDITKHSLITANLSYNYFGNVIVKDEHNNKLGISFKHLPREGLRTNHLERINKSEEKIKNITPEYVLGRYKDIFFKLNKYTGDLNE